MEMTMLNASSGTWGHADKAHGTLQKMERCAVSSRLLLLVG